MEKVRVFRFVKRAVRFIPLAALLLIAGCINYEQTTTLNMDGSGSASIHYWAEEGSVMFLSDGPLAFDEEKVKEQYAGEGITIHDVTIETNDEDSTRHVRVKLDFQNIITLAETKAFENVEIVWEEKDGLMNFKQTMKSKDDNNFGMGDYTITYVYEMPGEIVNSNATKEEGTTLTWENDLADLGGSGVILSATIKKSGMGGDLLMIILIIVGVILLVVIVIAVFGRKRKAIPEQTFATTGSMVQTPEVGTPHATAEDPLDESSDEDAGSEEKSDEEKKDQ
ncbi:MAG: hypothetical protein CL946_02370 [Ectothiorhodospiraceae bacterium]|nr:hypothetical protein [Ectothiorhodospiraceae bacterium]